MTTRKSPSLICAIACGLLTCLPLLSQSLDPFNVALEGWVKSAVFEKDGKLLLAGDFGTLAGMPLDHIIRLNPDGTPDTSFVAGSGDWPGFGYQVDALGIQPDGKILAAGSLASLGNQPCNNIVRLNRDGSLDSTFDCKPDGLVNTIRILPSGKILLGGSFSQISGQPRSRIARLQSNGTVDSEFQTATGGGGCMAVQPDGKILIAGFVEVVNNSIQRSIGRFHADGSVDRFLKSNEDSSISGLAVQKDGKILVSGGFNTLAGQSVSKLARLNPDGTLDDEFRPSPDAYVTSFALLADGKILVGGNFTNIAGVTSKYLARLHPDGSLDPSFRVFLDGPIAWLAIRRDGAVLVKGDFSTANDQPRNGVAIVLPLETAAEDLVEVGGHLQWQRRGCAPELEQVTFDEWRAGVGWRRLGEGVRIPEGWELPNYSPKSNVLVRAQGWCANQMNTWSMESTFVKGSVAPAIAEQPDDFTANLGATARFSLTAFGTAPLTYTWLKDNVPLLNSETISGAGTPFIIISNAQPTDVGTYSVIVSNAWGVSTSTAAVLKIRELFITKHPTHRTEPAENNTVFEVEGGGSPPVTFQWWKNGSLLVDGPGISGVNSALLTLQSVLRANEGGYSVTLSNSSGVLTSSVAQLTVLDPVIKTSPSDVQVDPLEAVHLNVEAAGTPPLSYQWTKGNYPVPGATNSTLTLQSAKASDAGSYRVQVANVYGTISNQVPAYVKVASPSPKYLRMLTNPVSQYILKGSDVMVTATADGFQPVSVQWYFATNGSPVRVRFATNFSLTLSNVASSRSIWAVVSNAYGVINSGAARIVVKTNFDVLGLKAEPLLATGWNRDIIVENREGTFADPGGFDGVFYFWKEVGYEDGFPRPHNLAGLPKDGRFQSLADSNVTFQLQPYDEKNALHLTSYVRSQQLTFNPPVRLQSLALLGAASGSPACSITLAFSDGSSTSIPVVLHDWWEGNEFLQATRRPAIAALGRVHFSSRLYQPDDEVLDMFGFSLDHVDIDFRQTDLTNKFLERLTFQMTGGPTAAILAVSGSTVGSMQLPELKIRADLNHQTLILSWSSDTTTSVVEQCEGLQSSWAPISVNPQLAEGTNFSLSLPLPPTNSFYRLRLF